MPRGVDYDSRCAKYRARLTRNGCVYHLGYFKLESDAQKARRRAEKQHNNGEKINFIHSYSTSSLPVEIENDSYLYFLSFADDSELDNEEKNIRRAVLMQSVKDSLAQEDTSDRKEARDWFSGKIESIPTYAFEDIAEILNLNPNFFRRALRRAYYNKKSTLKRLGRRLVRSNLPSGYE